MFDCKFQDALQNLRSRIDVARKAETLLNANCANPDRIRTTFTRENKVALERKTSTQT